MFDLEGNSLKRPTDTNQVAMRTYTVAHFDTEKPEMVLDIELPVQTKGYAVIKIEDEKDAVTLKKPEGVTVIWEHEQSLPSRLDQLPWLDGNPTAREYLY